jgi:PAS domain S-box-containing protein
MSEIKGHSGNSYRQGSRPTIGLLCDLLLNEYNIGLWRGVHDTARKHGANLLYFQGGLLHDPYQPYPLARVIYDLVSTEVVDGLVIWGAQLVHFTSPEALIDFCEPYRSLPIVNIGLELEGIPTLLIDNYRGMRELVTHLVEAHGYRRIAFIGGAEDNPEAQERYRGYTDVLREHNIPLDATLVVAGDAIEAYSLRQRWDETRANRYGGIDVLLDERHLQPGMDFEALVAWSDYPAIGATEELQRRGYRIPQDVAVAGFDDTVESRSVIPPLTTVRQSFYDLGAQATGMLLRRLRGEEIPERTRLPAEIVLRRSCGCTLTAVEQAAAGPAKSLQLAEGGSPEESIAARRVHILSEIAHAVDDQTGEAGEWAARLLDSFTAEVAGEARGLFLPTLESALNQVLAVDGNIAAWQGALSVLRREILPYLGDEVTVQRAEDLWQQARVLVGEMALQAQRYRELQTMRQVQALRELGQELTVTLELTELMDVLADRLPRLGLPSAYLALYEEPAEPAQWSRLMMACNESGRVALEPGGRRFPSRHLLPEGLWPQRQYSLIVAPLYFRERQLGFALLEVGPLDGNIYEELRAQISAALQETLLVQQSRRRALQLQTAAEVSRAASSILDPEVLAPQVVELVRERFDLYYVGLFLIDQTGEWTGEPNRWAVLRAGTGEAGRLMLQQGHKLEIGGASMIGWCIANKQARIALDVGKDAIRFDNPLLPETRSELALPLISRGRPIGALTIQSSREAAFSEEDITVLQTMADQLANAIANARLYNQAQQEIAERKRAEQELTQERNLFRALLDNLPDSIYFKDRESRFIRISNSTAEKFGMKVEDVLGKTDFDIFTEEHASQAYADEQNIIRTGQPIQLEEKETWPDGRVTWVLTSKMPLRDEQGNIIGTFGLSRDITARKLMEEELRKAHEELTRYTESLERRTVQLRVGAEVAREAAAILDVQKLLDTAVNLISERFGFYHAGVFLVDEPGEYAVLRAASSEGGKRMLARGHRLPVGKLGIVGYVAATGEPRVALDVGEDAVHFANPDLPETRSEIGLPLKVRGRVIGVLDVQSTQEAAFSEDDIVVLQTLADQLAVAIDNARLYEELAREHYLMDTLMDNVPDYIYFKDRESRFLRITRAHARVFGLSDPREAIGKTDFDFFSEEHARQAYEDEQRIIRTGEPLLNMEEKETWPDGRVTWVLTSKMPLRDEQGNIIGTFGLSRDITARKLMEEELRKAHEELTRYTESLERRTVQLRVGAEVAREAAAILDVQKLLDTAVNLISERFGFYHAGVFLVDEPGEYAVLRAASSEGGKRMLARGHRLPVGKLGIVGYVAATGEPRVALDVGEDAVHFANPDLPETRSEMGLPLKVRGRVIGVLDVQSTQEAAFSEDDIVVLQTLADQLAVAIDNARLMERTENQLRELSLLYGEYAASAWAELSSQRQALGYVYDRIDVRPADNLELPAIEMAIAQGETVALADSQEAAGRILATPLRLRDRVIGSLAIQESDGSHSWSPGEIALIEAVSEQVALALEEARHFAETQRAAQQMRILNELAQALTTRLDVEGVLEEAYLGASRLLDTSNFYIALYDAETESISFPIVVDHEQKISWPSRPMGNGLTEYIIRNRQPLLLQDNVSQRMKELGIDIIGAEAQSWLGVPISIGKRVLGVMAVQSYTTPGLYDARARDLLVSIASQTAIALQNARLFEQIQRQAERQRRIYEITSRIRRSPDIATILQTAVEELGEALRVDRALVRLVTKPREEEG